MLEVRTGFADVEETPNAGMLIWPDFGHEA
jgi:hypothetical protein